MEEIYKNRLKKISKKIGTNRKFIIPASSYQEEFQRQNINPYFLYFTMLEVHHVIPDAILLVETDEITCNLTIYSEPDDKTGINFGNTNIPILSIGNLPKIPEIGEKVKNKLDELRQIKDDWEIKQIKNAIKITEIGFKNMESFLKKNNKINEKDLEIEFHNVLIKNDASYAYPPIIASGNNGAHIHYNTNNSPILTRDSVLLDCGAKNNYGYCADITRTILPSNPTIYQKKVYDVVEKAFNDCYEYVCKNKNIDFNKLDKICIQSLSASVLKLGIKGNDNWNNYLLSCSQNPNNIRTLYTHYIGHNVGLQVHDPGRGKLKKNMVITIEPGLYFPENNPVIPEQYKKIGGVRIEHMILIKNNPQIIG